jgi:tripartite ATP-independent transporter DctM subunit
MLIGLIVAIFTGFPLALAVGSIGIFMGLLTRGLSAVDITYYQVFSKIHSYTLLAVPMFVFMGSILEASGMAEKMFQALFVVLGRLRGGLALSTVVVGTVIATCVGVISASVSMLTLVALPAMIRRGYSKSLASGTVAASGTLGILIPPSIMLVVIGPLSGLSVGKLFAAAFPPGFLLAGVYMVYVVIRCAISERLGPPVTGEEASIPLGARLQLLVGSIVPPAIVVVAVLGSILLGLASPTEAAAFGAFATTIMVIGYRKFTLAALKNALNDTMKVTGMALLIATLSVAYTSVFLALGGGEIVTDAILAVPGGRWGSFALIMFIVFILGMFLDWMGIVFVIVPILLPANTVLGFDLLWFIMMVVLNIQTGFLSPPFAMALFILRGTADPSLGIEYGDMIRGVLPFIACVFAVLVLCAIFPEIILWLPRVTFG